MKALILFASIIIANANTSNYYTIYKNFNVNQTGNETLLISRSFKQSKFLCLASCNSFTQCLSLIFYNSNLNFNCFLYTNYFSTFDLIPSTDVVVYTKYEGSFCSGSPSFNCVCSSSQYYDYFTNKCETLIANTTACTQIDACRSDLGLSCLTGLCQCNSTYQFWNGTHCVNYLSYNEGTCTSSSQCNAESLLTCVLTAASTCNCPNVVPVGKCDCPSPVFGLEYFWNSTTSTCKTAAAYNQSCSTGNYTCLTLAENTYCNLVTKTCECDANINRWNGTICTSCLPNWTFHRGSCFRVSSVDAPSALTGFTSAFVSSSCYNQPGVRLAILQNSDALSTSFASVLTTDDCYFDANRLSNTQVIYDSFYTPGYTIDSSAAVWTNGPGGAQSKCARLILASPLNFVSYPCGGIKKFICQYEIS